MSMIIYLHFLYKKTYEYLSSFFLVLLHSPFWSPSGSDYGQFQLSLSKEVGDVAVSHQCAQMSLGGVWCWCWGSLPPQSWGSLGFPFVDFSHSWLHHPPCSQGRGEKCTADPRGSLSNRDSPGLSVLSPQRYSQSWRSYGLGNRHLALGCLIQYIIVPTRSF